MGIEDIQGEIGSGVFGEMLHYGVAGAKCLAYVFHLKAKIVVFLNKFLPLLVQFAHLKAIFLNFKG